MGVLAGFLALWATDAWAAPGISAGFVSWPRVWAVVLASGLTVVVTLLIQATQPAAVATTLLVALGAMQTWQNGFMLMGGVLLMLVLGQPVRLWRLRNKERMLKQSGERP